MRNGRIARSLALIATASLVLGAFVAAPAEAKKKKKPAGCAAYVPGEAGADAPAATVTSANTADAPGTMDLDIGPGLGSGRDASSPEGSNVSHAYLNLLADPSASSDVLTIRVSWTEVPYDYDLYLDTADGTQLAASAGYGPLAFGASDYESSGIGSETIVAYPVSDCDGFTADIVGATTPGGTVTVDYWLGE